MRVANELGQARTGLLDRLQARRPEIEQAVLTRVYHIADPAEAADPAYAEGLRAAVSAALDYGLAGLEGGGERAPPIPTLLFAQTRLAVRNGVSLDVILRRYFGGYALLGDFLIGEAEAGGVGRTALKRLVGTQATNFDRLIVAISEEYAREAGSAEPGTSEQRRAEHVQRLLAGESLDTTGLAYEFDAFHLGLLLAGHGAVERLGDLCAALDCCLLLVQPDEQAVWAWLGARRSPDPAQVESHLAPAGSPQMAIAFGEPARGLAGWRLTHRQARAALPIAQRGQERVIRYADVALLASVLQDDLLATSLRELYLAPLEAERDNGKVARETLRAYFAAHRNVSSAAAALGVDRHTVTRRLRAVEERLGAPLGSRAFDLEAALRLEELRCPDPSNSTSSPA